MAREIDQRSVAAEIPMAIAHAGVLLGFIGMLIALGTAYTLYNTQLSRPAGTAGATPQQTIDLTSVRAALMEIGQAQRIYLNAHGAYGTLDQLRADGPPSLGQDRRGYVFTVEANGAQSFIATATPSASARPDAPTLAIDERLEISTR
jgi:hypothetical protein